MRPRVVSPRQIERKIDMATLKICAEETQWLTDVTRIIQKGHFDIPEDPDSRVEAVRQRVWNAAKKAGFVGDDPSRSVFSADFGKGDRLGVVLDVFFKGEETEPHIWLVPLRSCYLMGDDGGTIDRI
jgi:hypothetical protein